MSLYPLPFIIIFNILSTYKRTTVVFNFWLTVKHNLENERQGKHIVFTHSFTWPTLSSFVVFLFQEGGALPGPKRGLLSNTRKRIDWGDTCADKARDFTGKGCLGGEQWGKGTQEDCSAAWLAVLVFMVLGWVSRFFSVSHSDSGSFLVVHALFSQNGCQREGFWEVVGHVLSPFDLSQILPVGGGLLVACSLTRTSCCEITHTDGYYGTWPVWVLSVSVPPLTFQGCIFHPFYLEDSFSHSFSVSLVATDSLSFPWLRMFWFPFGLEDFSFLLQVWDSGLILLPDQTWVRLPLHSKFNSTDNGLWWRKVQCLLQSAKQVVGNC